MDSAADSPTDLAATLAAAAARTPDAIAVRLGDQQLRYGELDARVDAAAAALQALGIAPGDRVAVVLGNRPSFVVAAYAIWRAGGILVPVNPSLTAPELRHELADCGAAAVIVGKAYADVIGPLREDLPALRHVLLADAGTADGAGAGAAEGAEPLRSWSAAIAEHQGAAPAPVPRTSDDPALLAYTSGATGTPKGALLTSGNLLANHRQLAASDMGVAADDVVYVALPLFHIYALNVAMAMSLAAGATLELVERFDPAGDLQLLVDRRATVVVGAPPMYVAWLNTPGADQIDLSGVRLATSGAAGLPAEVLRRCAEELGLDVREGYGLTEASPVVAASAALPRAVPGSVGRPLAGVELRIVDEGAEALPGDPGVVHVRGDNVFRGYWEQPEATARVLDDDGWLDTGDIGYLDDDGLLHLVDRARDLIIVSGFNVYPVEVEAALGSHPAVLQAAAIGVPHPYTGEAVKAFVVVEPGSEVTADELIGHVAGRLARFKRPEAVEFVPELPVLPTGKLQRRVLRGA